MRASRLLAADREGLSAVQGLALDFSWSRWAALPNGFPTAIVCRTFQARDAKVGAEVGWTTLPATMVMLTRFPKR